MPRIFATYCEPFHTSAKIVSGPRQDVLKVSLCRCSQGVGYGPGTRWSACQKRRSKGNCGSPPMTRDRLGLISFLLLGHDEQRDQGQHLANVCSRGGWHESSATEPGGTARDGRAHEPGAANLPA